VAKFHGDRPRELGDFALRKVKTERCIFPRQAEAALVIITYVKPQV